MKTSGKFTNIQNILKKFLAAFLLTGVCPLFAATYRWTGSGANTNWSTTANWETYNTTNSSWESAASAPGSSDDVIIKTSTTGTDPIIAQNISITLDTDVTINGLISFGLGNFTITSTGKTFNATTVFIGSSAHNYRTNEAPAVISSLPDIDYITENHQGNISIEGSTTVNIKNLDTSSWTKNDTKNVVSIKDTSIFIVSDIWNTGGIQGTTSDRTEITKDSTATIAVTGEIEGDNECKDDLTEGLDNSGAAVVETPVPEANQTNVYIWIGATDENWSTSTNWLNNTVPNSLNAEVSIPKTSNNPKISSAIKVNTLTIAKGAEITITGTTSIASISNKGTIKIQSGTLEYSGSEATISNIEITEKAIIDGGTNGLSFTNTTFNSNPDITTKGNVLLPSGTVGNFTIDSGTTTLQEGTVLSAKSITINSSASLTCTEGTDLSVSGNWTNNAGTSGFTCGTGTVNFTANSTIAGNSTFYNFTCTTGGTDLSFEAGSTQTISNQLTITGSSGSPITLKSSTPGSTWNIDVAIEKALVAAAKIQDSVSENDSITATSSVSLGNNKYWKIPGKYKWETPSTGSWNTASNWKVLQLDGLTYNTAETYPQYEDDEVIISSTVTTATLPSDITLKQITVNEDATLDFAGNSLTVPSITNNGTIKLHGTQTIQNAEGNDVILSSGDSSTIEYYGGSSETEITVSSFFTTTFKKLKINQYSTLQLGTNNLTVASLENNGTIKINGSGNINQTDIDSGLFIYTGTASIKNFNTDGTADYYDLQISTNDSTPANTELNVANKLIIDSGKTLTLGGNLAAEEIINNGEIVCGENNLNVKTYTGNSDTISINGGILKNDSSNDITITTLTPGDNESTIDCGSGSVTVTNSFSAGKIKTIGNFTAQGSFIGLNVASGKFTASDDISISGTGAYLTVANSATLDISSYNLILTGDSADKLEVKGTGTISITNSQINGKYISIDTSSCPAISGGKIYTAINSTTATTTPVNGWNILSGDLVYIWNGSSSTDLNTPANWNTNLVPNQIDSIQIPSISNASPNYPKLTDDVIFANVTVNAGATLDFANYNLTAAKFSNNGTIRFSGTNSITAEDKSYGTANSIEYYGTSPNAVTGTGAPAADNYKNLTITSGTSLSLNASSITVGGTFSNEGTVLINDTGVFNITGTPDSDSGLVKYTSTTATTKTIPDIGFYDLEINAGDWTDTSSTGISSTKNFTISGGSFTCYGNLTVNKTLTVNTDSYVKFNNGTEGQTSNATSAVFTNGTIYFGNNEADSFSVTGPGNSLSLSGSSTFHTAGTLSGENGITVGTDLTSDAATTFASAVTLTGASTISNGTNTITFSSTIDGDFSLSTSGAGTVTLKDSVGTTTQLASLSLAGPVNINCAEIKTNGNQTYNGNLTLSKNVTISAESGNLIQFAGTINGNSKDLTINTANSQFDNAVSNVNNLKTDKTTTINTNSIQTIENQTYTNLIFSNNLVLTGKNITFNGDASDSASPSFHNLTITNSGLFKTEDGKNITCSNFTQNGSGKNMLGGSLNSASGTWGTDLYVYGTSYAQISGAQNISENFIIAKTSKTSKLTSPVTASNVVLYSGDVTASADITSKKDVVLLGSKYAVTDNVSGTENAYIYEQTRYSGNDTGIKNNYTIETNFPDNSNIPLNDGKLTISSGTLTSLQNFYANGLSISGNIKLKDNSDSTSSFAEAYNCTVTDSTVSEGQIACEGCSFNGSNTNWNQTPLIIEEAYTVRDNCVYIRFNRPLRNKHGELNKALTDGFLTFSNGTFTGIYSDADCLHSIEKETEPQEFYLKASSSWNTDATGTSAGTTDSTDRTGSHKSSIPYVDIVRNIIKDNISFNWIITDIYGKRLDNYSTKTTNPGNSYNNVEDHTGPVLYSVRTGQEQHTPYDSSIGESSQPAYDAHNFIEFRYSEPVNFGNSTGKSQSDNLNSFDNTNLSTDIWLPAADALVENVRVNNTFGALSNDNELSFIGLATIESGLIKTGTNGSLSKYVNSLYRNDPYSIRLSIAGYVDESNPVVDASGNTYKNWIGYIEYSEIPSGTVSVISDSNIFITDCALSVDGSTVLYNPQIKYAESEKVEPKVNYQYSASTETLYPNTDVYGNWDTLAPCFAPYNASKKWTETGYYEAIGTNGGAGSTLDRIEFHIFDNTPDFNSVTEPVWYFEKGWVKYSEETSSLPELYNSESYAADTAGGARAWKEDSNRTTGGLRFCSYLNSSDAFKYTHNSDSTPSTAFDSDPAKIYQGTVSPIFISASGSSHTTNDPDSLYFGLTLSELTLSVDTTFSISYTADSSKGFITDLAGNRLKSAELKTLDRTPPSINITLSPVNNKELYISFVKQIQTDSSDIRLLDNTTGSAVSIPENFFTLFPQCFEIIEIENDGTAKVSADLAIDYAVPAELIESTSNEKFTGIKVFLTKDVTLENLKNLYIRLRRPENYNHTFKDPLTSISDSNVTLIQDSLGNYMKYHTAHALSDFAVNVINPLYAYDEEFNNDSSDMMYGIYEDGSWTVHDFNADQQNYGTLAANHPIAIVTATEDGTTQKSQLPEHARIYLSASPDAQSISSQYNSDFDTDLRIWLPKINFVKNNRYFATTFSSISSSANTNYLTCDSNLVDENNLSEGFIFNLPLKTVQNWNSGSQISFMFSLQNENNEPITIFSSPYLNVNDTYSLTDSTPYPLFALRLKESSDITSIDLWSVKLKSITEQRGGVTILNNVINSTNGEKTIIKVNTTQEEILTVAVMTLDGNIVQYLQKGKTAAGEHYYSWNGKTKNGKQAARGMYFVRVFGKNIDETRKIMVVK